MRRVCLLPSRPVMFWTRMRLCAVSQMAMSVPLRGKLGRETRGTVHGVDAADQRVAGGLEDRVALVGVVAVEPDDERLVDRLALVAQQLQRLDDAVSHLVAGGD